MEGEWRSLEDEGDEDINEDLVRSSFFSLHESWNESRSSSSLDTTPTDINQRQHQKYA